MSADGAPPPTFVWEGLRVNRDFSGTLHVHTPHGGAAVRFNTFEDALSDLGRPALCIHIDTAHKADACPLAGECPARWLERFIVSGWAG